MHTSNPDNDISVTSESVEPPSWTDRYEEFVHAILADIGVGGLEFSIVFCDDATIRTLNAEYRDRDEVTDVLSFVADEGERLPVPPDQVYRPAGDIVISLEQVRAQAEEIAIPYEEEVRRVTVHGVLHLLGETHDSYDFSSDPMLVHQEAILNRHKERLF